MDAKGVIAIGIGALVVGMTAGAVAFPVQNDVIVEKTIEVPVIVKEEVKVEVPVEKIVEVFVDKVVEVKDTEAVNMLCDRLLYDDVLECESEIKAEDAALELVFNAIGTEDFFDFLQDEAMISDEDEARIKKIYKDFEDVEIVSSDYEEEQYEFKVIVKVYDEDLEVTKKLLVTATVDEKEVSFEEVELIE